jgi:hypothetical protein
VGAVAGAVTGPSDGYKAPPPGHYRGRKVGHYR